MSYAGPTRARTDTNRASMLPRPAITRSSTHAVQPMRSANGDGDGGALKAARSVLAFLAGRDRDDQEGCKGLPLLSPCHADDQERRTRLRCKLQAAAAA